ncbi:MAG: prepilin-type N-terminal cleavage/methylation domain-containing protein [Phycisphaerales bacterium]|nr:prepilin-type N-terminal cleavage/methylation domain-containing protein [Phycisphaerales bacterium]
MQQLIPSPRPERSATARGGFTLIEVVVVLGIIAILAAVSVVVFGRVTEGGRRSQTENIIRTLDATLDTLAAEREGGRVPSRFVDDKGGEFAIFDGRMDSAPSRAVSEAAEPSLGFFLAATRQVQGVQSAFNQIPGEFSDKEEASQYRYKKRGQLVRAARIYDASAASAAEPSNPSDVPEDVPLVTRQGAPLRNVSPGDTKPPAFPTLDIRDPWGNQIRFVHPGYGGGYGDFYRLASGGAGTWESRSRAVFSGEFKQGGGSNSRKFNRSCRPFDPTDTASQGSGKARLVGDADEGTPTGRAYFYSPGPDRDPGARGDNVYSGQRPQFPAETRAIE